MLVGGGGGRQLNYFLFIFITRFEGDKLRFRLRAFFVLGSVEGCCACVTACQK